MPAHGTPVMRGYPKGTGRPKVTERPTPQSSNWICIRTDETFGHASQFDVESQEAIVFF